MRSFQSLKVPLQKRSLQICRAVDGEDGVRTLPSFDKGGDGLPHVQVVQVTGHHAFGGGDTGFDLHLQRRVSEKMRIQMEDAKVKDSKQK